MPHSQSVVIPPVTWQSIEDAKQANAREREAVYRQTGVRIDDAGRIHLPTRTERAS